MGFITRKLRWTCVGCIGGAAAGSVATTITERVIYALCCAISQYPIGIEVKNINEKRENINRLAKNVFHFELFQDNKDTDTALISMNKPCITLDNFKSCMGQLYILTDARTDELKKAIDDNELKGRGRSWRRASINEMQILFEREIPDCDTSCFTTLRNIIIVKNKFEHKPSFRNDKELLDVLEYLGWTSALDENTNWNELWYLILQKYGESLSKIEGILQQKVRIK